MNNEHTLISLVLQGDTTAFEALLASVRPAAITCIRKYMRENADVEDVFQDCALKAWIHMSNGKYKHSVGSGFQAWFVRTVRNQSIDVLRKRSNNLVYSSETYVLNQLTSSYAPDYAIVQREAEERWELLLSRLSSTEQMVIRARYEEYKDFNQIAIESDGNGNTLRGVSRRAREKIRLMVNKKPPG